MAARGEQIRDMGLHTHGALFHWPYAPFHCLNGMYTNSTRKDPFPFISVGGRTGWFPELRKKMG